jgi:hypothetical protein
MGRTDYTLPPEKQAEYASEHSPEMIARLKDLGVNFLMIHCYKGAGLKTEREGLDDARRFAQLAHQSGLRVGTYIGGTMLFERRRFVRRGKDAADGTASCEQAPRSCRAACRFNTWSGRLFESADVGVESVHVAGPGAAAGDADHRAGDSGALLSGRPDSCGASAPCPAHHADCRAGSAVDDSATDGATSNHAGGPGTATSRSAAARVFE